MRGPVVVRPASVADVDALVELRLENGRVHASLDPALYRVPDRAEVRNAFHRMLPGPDDRTTTVLVATLDSRVVGTAEVVPSPPPPPDQILIPVRTAQIHIVVEARSRGAGVGTRLRLAAEDHARAQGIDHLVAPVQASNTAARTFYGAAGYRENGHITVKAL